MLSALLLVALLILPVAPALGQSLVFSSSTVTVNEGATQTYTVKLATMPSADVTVQIRSLDKGAATALPLRMTFTTTNWNTEQTVTVSGTADPDRTAETVTLRHRTASGDSSYDDLSSEVTATVTDTAGFSLNCGSTVAEGATLTCTLSNPGSSATPWPGVAIFHLSEDANRALVRGGDLDVEFGTLTPNASADFDQDVEGGVWWVGQVLVAYERFDWSGEAAASASRTIPIIALDDALYEGDEQFYITLTPDGTRNTTALYYDTHEQTITVTDTDTASTDTSLASLDIRAPGAASAISTTLSGASYTASVAYEVSEVVVTPTATHHAATIVVGSDAEEVESGGTSRIFQLTAGGTTNIPVTVTAENGTSTATSTITLTRASLPQTVTVTTDAFSLACPSVAREGVSFSCTLTNTTSSTQKFPVVALIHSSLDGELVATVAEDSILPASDPAYQDDISFPTTVRTSDTHEYTYGYGELFSGGSEEYVTYGYEKFTRTDDDTTTAKEDEVAAGGTQTVSIEPQPDTDNNEERERFYVGLAPAGYTGLKQLVSNKVQILLDSFHTQPSFGSNTATRSVAENTAADQPIGAPVAAIEPDGDDLTYTLGGLDASSFDIDTASGQLKTKTGVNLNHEAKDSYSVTVGVTDGEDEDGNDETTATEDDSVTVTITVTDVNETPEVSGPTSVSDYAENSTHVVATFNTTDPENDPLTWTLTGSDANDFTIMNGDLRFASTPDFEAPADTGRNNEYTVTVNVSDAKNAAGTTDTSVDATVAVTVTVTNVNEMGSVTLSGAPAREGRPLRAALADPDGITANSITWTWEQSVDQNSWTAITTGVSSSGAMSRYTPTSDDANMSRYLRVSAEYTDTAYGTQSVTQRLTDGMGTPTVVQPLPTPELRLESDSIAEHGAGNSTTVTAHLNLASDAMTVVTLTTAPEYTLGATRLTIPAGSLISGSVTLTARDNNVDVPDGSVEVSVSGGATNTDGLRSLVPATLTITDDDDAPTVTLKLSSDSVDEGGMVNVTAELGATSTLSSDPIELTATATAVSPTTTDDFTQSGTTLTIAAGQRRGTGTVTVTADDDDIDEPPETVSVGATVTQGTATAPEAVLLTLRDTDATPTLTLELDPATIGEAGGESTVTARLPASSSVSSATIAVTVSAVAVAPATAADFTLSDMATLTILPEQRASSGTAVTAVNNNLDAPDKTVTVTGTVDSYGVGGTIAPATQTLTIEDDEAPVVTLVLSDTDSSISEGETVDVTATLSHASSADIAVTVEVTAGADAVTPRGRTLTFKKGSTASTGEVTLTAKDNDVDAPDKTVTITGTGPAGRADITVAAPLTLTVTDNDTRGVTLALPDRQPLPSDGLAIPEGDTGHYIVVLDSQPTATVEIGITSNESAVSVSPTPLTFTAGNWNTAQTVMVGTAHDSDGADLTATLTHTLTTAEGSDYRGVTVADVAVTVNDDESPSTAAALSVSPTAVGEGAARPVRVTATLNRAVLLQDVEVTVRVAADTATAADFGAVEPFALTIPARDQFGTATFTLTPVDDNIDEPAETVTVSGMASALSEGVTGTTLTIQDNDPPPTLARLEVTAERIDEASGGATLTAYLSNRSSSETVVGLTVPAGAGAVTLNPNPLTIPAEADSGTVSVSGVSDDVYTSHRPVTLQGRVTSPASSVRRDVRLTVLDDDRPEVTGNAAATVTEGHDRAVAPYTVTSNPADVRLVWAVDGTDASTFAIDANGRLRFTDDPDHEGPGSYDVTIQAADESLPEVTLIGTLPVRVTVADAPGTVELAPATPRAGSPLTATVSDRDAVGTVTEWCWARSPLSTFPDTPEHPTTELGCTTSDLTATATYTPVADDLNHYLRATVTYTDGDDTSKPAAGVTAHAVARRSSSRTSTTGSGGLAPSGGGGGADEPQDDHGNTLAQATQVVLGAAPSTTISGRLHAPDDVDYFEFPLPRAGLLVVETMGPTDTVGTVWQDGAMLTRADGGGERQNFQLRTPVAARPVVVAVEGQNGQTGAYTLEARLLTGHLENPGAGAFQSGIGVISGWVCAAAEVEIQIGAVPPQRAAYGTERRDTEPVCGDTDNGFGLLFNWNLVGDGEHEVVAVVDGVELGRATVTVTTLGEEFLRDRTGTCEVEAFPTGEETRTVAWQQTSQNFVLVAGARPQGPTQAGRAGVGQLENPGPNALQSGIGVLSGWVCEGEAVELEIGHVGRQRAAYGTERLDTLAVCGDTDNGFGLLFNWNLVGDGEHEVVAFVDGAELSRATVRVTTLGEEFVWGVEGECLVEDFPDRGQTVTLAWQQTSQNFVIVDRE